ncbi:MAG TPA: FAD-dependent oxidoreductase [Solirubrobacterales bacterium]|nr:FAD-dependent oxidoreductase [Solirubrobacterales bacterium]
MSKPLLLAVDADPASLREVEGELRQRYERDYRVLVAGSSRAALARLEEASAAGEDIALVLAAQWLDEMSGSELLGRVRALDPFAQRSLLIDWASWGDGRTGEAIFHAMARRQIEYYVVRPSVAPDELFHQSVMSFLLEWAHARRAAPHTIHVIGESWTGRAYELRQLLGRCALTHTFALADSAEARELLAKVEADGEPLPLVVFPNGEVLSDPTNAEIAEAAGATVDPQRSEFDLVVVGAGPAGLSAAVYGASEGFRTLVVDEGGIGGQATSSSLIRNYLGFPRGVSGRRLAEQAYEQAWVFGARFALMHGATDLRREDGLLVLSLTDGAQVRARAVLVASGATYRRLPVPELERLTGAGVFYGGTASEAPAMAGLEVFVVGGANSAGQAALHLADYARRVTLVVRKGDLELGMSDYLVRQVEEAPNVAVRLGTEVVGGGGGEWLERLELRDADGATETVPADGLFLMIGADPNTAWLPPEVLRDEGGYLLTGEAARRGGEWPLDRDPFALETTVPGLFAAGDVRSGSMSRVAAAVGEGGITVRMVHQLFAAESLTPLRR